jgi:Raf kinase inhibitor-like YbhB/YbcL family protein
MFTAQTTAFDDGATVPEQFTCDGADRPPDIDISHPPAGTRSFALIMEDPDAPGGTFTHWLAYDIPVSGGSLAVADGKTLANSFGRNGYGGPCPPPGNRAHRYVFTVYAVNVPVLDLGAHSQREDLERALRAHTLAAAHFSGRYARAA